MDDIFRNGSGYYDSTCGLALTNIEKSEKRRTRSLVLMDVLSIQEELQSSLTEKGFEYMGNGKLKHIKTKNIFTIRL